MIFCVADCNGNIHKSRASPKGIITDARYAVADCHAREHGATDEGKITDSHHAVGDCYTC